MLEIACFNVASALTAAASGANRIELCANQAVGGITPPLPWLEKIKSQLPSSIPVYVMIRPRGGDFVYTDAEFASMRDEIEVFKKSGADGFVFGVLTHEEHSKKVDVVRTTELVRLASPRSCTFHRAFDEVLEDGGGGGGGLEDVIQTGCAAILSSGGKANALEGSEVLGELVRRAGERIVVIPGGGVRAGNLERIRRTTGAGVVHSSGLIAGSGEEIPDVGEIGEMVRLMR